MFGIDLLGPSGVNSSMPTVSVGLIHGYTPIGFLFVRRDINMIKKNSTTNALNLDLLHGKVQNLN